MEEKVNVAVCGAHMSGLPLNQQMLDLGAEFVEKTKTAPHYRLFRLDTFKPPRPGMLRVNEDGHSIKLEVWKMSKQSFGALVASIGSPLGFGSIMLEDGAMVHGFICEAFATEDAIDITEFGGWRNYIQQEV